MLKRFACGVAVAMVATVTAAAGAADASAPRVYVGLGDSVAVGVGAPTGKGYVDRYFEYLRDPARGRLDRLVNLAVGGETSASMRRANGQLEQALRLIRRPSNVVVVTLDIGGNDALQRLCPAGFGDSSCAFEDNFGAILEALDSALADDPGRETIQVMQYYNPASGTGTPFEALYDAIGLGADRRIDCTRTGADRGLNDVIACVGAERGAQAIDPSPSAKAIGPPFVSDGTHPSVVGHAAIACLFEHPERAGSADPCRVLTLSGRHRQRVLDQRAIIVSVRTAALSTVVVSARIRIPGPAPDIEAQPVMARLAARSRTSVEIRLAPQARRSIRRALRHHHRLSAAVSVKATDASGRSTDEARTYSVTS
jgi:lysophospholipase L1-like esterase